MAEPTRDPRSDAVYAIYKHIHVDPEAAPFLIGWLSAFLTTDQLVAALQALHERDAAIAKLAAEQPDHEIDAWEANPQD